MYFSAGNASARVFRLCVLVEGASVAQSLTPLSVSDLCPRELPFGVLFDPETGLTLVAQFLVPSSWALDALEHGLEVPKTSLSAKKLLPPQPA